MEKSYLTEIMKKVSIFSILFLCALHCWAQKEYAPLAVEGKIWEVHRYGPAPDCSIIETYMVKGDTLVGDKTSMKNKRGLIGVHLFSDLILITVL